MKRRSLGVASRSSRSVLGVLGAILFVGISDCARRPAIAPSAITDEPRGWLVIEGGSYPVSPVVAAKFRELVGGADAKVLFSPTAMADSEMRQCATSHCEP